MITVEIAINLGCIKTISAINTGTLDNVVFQYDVYLGLSREQAKEIKKIEHVRADGAEVLAIKMLEAFK